MGYHKDSLCLEAGAVLFHQLQGAQGTVKAALTALERHWEDLAEDGHVSQSEDLFFKDVMPVLWIYLRVLPLLLTPQSLLFP